MLAKEMPKYINTNNEQVWALKIKDMINCHINDRGILLFFEDKGYASIRVSDLWYTNNKPIINGYYVVSKLGNTGFISNDEFNSKYHKLN